MKQKAITETKIAVVFVDRRKCCLKKDALKKGMPCHAAVDIAVPGRQATAE